MMRIYITNNFPSGCRKLIGFYFGGIIYVRKSLPLPILIYTLYHEVLHHIDRLFPLRLWIFYEYISKLICQKWIAY